MPDKLTALWTHALTAASSPDRREEALRRAALQTASPSAATEFADALTDLALDLCARAGRLPVSPDDGGAPARPLVRPFGRQLSARAFAALMRELETGGSGLLKSHFAGGLTDARLLPALLSAAEKGGEMAHSARLALLEHYPELLPSLAAVLPPREDGSVAAARTAREKGDFAALSRLVPAMGESSRHSPEVFVFLAELLPDVLSGRGAIRSLEFPLVATLAACGTRQALHVLEKHAGRMRHPHAVVSLALELYTPEEFFDRYAPGDVVPRGPLRDAMLSGMQLRPDLPLDERWLDYFIDCRDGLMVSLTACAAAERAWPFLRRFLDLEKAPSPPGAHDALLAFAVFPKALALTGAEGFEDELWRALRGALLRSWKSGGTDWALDPAVIDALRPHRRFLSGRLTGLYADAPDADTLDKLIRALNAQEEVT